MDKEQYTKFSDAQIGSTINRPVLVSAIVENTARNGNTFVKYRIAVASRSALSLSISSAHSPQLAVSAEPTDTNHIGDRSNYLFGINGQGLTSFIACTFDLFINDRHYLVKPIFSDTFDLAQIGS